MHPVSARARPAALALVVCLTVLGAARALTAEPRALSELSSLRALDTAPADAPTLVALTRTLFTTVNERWLQYLPPMPVLRAEDAVASIALAASGKSAPARDVDDERLVERLAVAGWSPGSWAREAVSYASTAVLSLSGQPVAAAVTTRLTR